MRLAIACLVVLSGCAEPSDDCLSVPGSVSALRGGGWDANGSSLRGGWDGNGTSTRGGWDRNGAEPGAEIEGATLADAEGRAVDVVGGRLVDAEGRERSELALVASTASGGRVNVGAALDRIEGGVALYRVTVDGTPVCDGAALFAPGAWDDAGRHHPGGVTLACARGVIAKCMLWGYAPWVVGEATHAACTRMARADYCGDGSTWTRDGTLIDVTDPAGVQELAGGMVFEAGWGPEGAVCASTTRWDVTGADGQPVTPPCWAALPPCGDAEAAFAAGALTANGTLHAPIAACR